MKNKNSQGFIQIIIILVVLAAIGGAYSFVTKNKQNVVSELPTASPVVSIEPTFVSTANWKVYVNTKYGFSFKYPEKENGTKLAINEQPLSVGVFLPDGEVSYISVEVIPNGDVESDYRKHKEISNTYSSLENATFNGYPAYKTTIPGINSYDAIFYILRGSILYRIEGLDGGQILSTFKFTN